MPEKEHPQKELFAADSDETKAQAIVDDVLGEGVVDYHRLPKNVGVMGDEGVRAHTILVYGISESHVQELIDSSKADSADPLETLVDKVISGTSAASRVLIDITRGQEGVVFFADDEKT